MTAIRPTLILPALRNWVETEVRARTNQHVARKTEAVLSFVNAAFFRSSPHGRPGKVPVLPYSEFSEQFLWGASFSIVRLRSSLGKDYKRFIDPFFLFDRGSSGYHVTSGATKLYMLRPEVVAHLTDLWADSTGGFAIDAVTAEKLSPSDLPTNGVIRTLRSRIHVPGLLKFDAATLDRSIQELESLGRFGEGVHLSKRRQHVLTLRNLYRVRQWVRWGGLPNLYYDFKPNDDPTSGNGRLWGEGRYHIQRLPRRARSLLYSGTGWFGYDFVACHPSILFNLARAYGEDVPFIEDYLNYRAEVTTELADEWDVPPAKVKKVITALFYGQRPTAHQQSGIARSVGRHSAKKVVDTLYYLMLRDEVNRLTSLIIDRHTNTGVVVNAVGKRLRVEGADGKRVGRLKLLSHVLTGYEAWMLDTACAGSDAVAVLMHDGWVTARQVDEDHILGQIESRSKTDFGFPLVMRVARTSFS